MTKKRSSRGNLDILSLIVGGIFKMLWWIVSLPFRGLRRRRGMSVNDRQYILARREEIERNLQSNNIFELKHAVMEADKLLDYTLSKRGFAGETLAEKLKKAQRFLSHENYNQLWSGHKIRNQVAHEHGINFSENQLRGAARKLLNIQF